jgi:hypothetical protein
MANERLNQTFVVNGTSIQEPVNSNQPLHSVLGKILAAAGVPGDADPSRWEFKYKEQVLDPSQKFETVGLDGKTPIFVNLKAGAVG